MPLLIDTILYHLSFKRCKRFFRLLLLCIEVVFFHLRFKGRAWRFAFSLLRVEHVDVVNLD